METTTTASTAPLENNQGGKYKISDDAIKSLRQSRIHSVARQHSGNSAKEQPPVAQIDTSRYSNRSSSSSIWSNFMKRGRRVYGSAVSVASSITLSEFGEFSEEFGISDRSLDARQFASPANDSKPELPTRQSSMADKSSSSHLTSSRPSLINSGHTLMHSVDENRSQEPLPPPPPAACKSRSADLSPKQPGRKTSISVCSDTQQAITIALSSSDMENMNDNRIDSAPQYPNRKKSSKVMDEESLVSEMRFKDLREQSKLFRDHMEEELQNNIFSGAVAIDHMFGLGLITSRAEGVELGQKMETELGLIIQSSATSNSNGKAFCDEEEALYQLAPTPVLDMASPSPFVMTRKKVTAMSIEEEEASEEQSAELTDCLTD